MGKREEEQSGLILIVCGYVVFLVRTGRRLVWRKGRGNEHKRKRKKN